MEDSLSLVRLHAVKASRGGADASPVYPPISSSPGSAPASPGGCQLSARRRPRGRLMSSRLPDHYTTCSPPQGCPLAAPPLEMLGWPLL